MLRCDPYLLTSPRARLDTATGTPDLSGSNTRTRHRALVAVSGSALLHLLFQIWLQDLGRFGQDEPKFRKTMYFGKKIVVVMPAYNAAKTVTQTVDEVLQQHIVDEIILVDDRSRDDTVAVASSLLGVRVHVHERNVGYGGNQKTCYRLALEAGADIVIMLHPDYQYTPKLIPAMASIIANGLHPCVLGSRILGGYSLKGGMPVWKYIANRFLTLAENVLLGAKLSEYHTGYRAFSREILETLDWGKNSDDFVFDNQMLAQIFWHGFTIGEVSFDQFPAQPQIRLWLSGHRIEIPSGENGMAPVGTVQFNAAARRDFFRLTVARGSTPDLTALSNAEWTPGRNLTASSFLPAVSSVR
jgi:hypothetical protein